MRGSRVQAVVGELQGEKIDIIPWSPDAASFIVNALQPAEVAKVVLDEDAERIEVVVPDDQLSLAIGRRGQNVRLASQLTGWDIDILTEQEESRAPPEGIRRALDTCSWTRSTSTRWSARCWPPKASPRSRKSPIVDADEIASIEGFDEDTASEIQTRARDYLEKIEAEHDAKRKELGVADELREIPGVTTAMLVALGEDGVKTIEDFAGCAADDLVGWTERKDGETKSLPGRARRSRRVARRCRADGHGGPPEGRLDHRRRTPPTAEAERRRSGPARDVTPSAGDRHRNEMNDRTCIVTRDERRRRMS